MILLAALPASLQAQTDESYAALLDSKAPSIVTIRVVMKTEMSFQGQSQDEESRTEVAGVIVSTDGLIMSTYDTFGSDDQGSGPFSVKRIPKEIKVIFEREEQEYDAELVATDKRVRLAFLQVLDLEGRELVPVSFDPAASVDLGDRVASVGRLEKGFDYAPYVTTAQVSGRIKKPRKALMLDGSISTEGLPVFTMTGEVVGVLTTIESGMAASEEEEAMGMLRVILGSGGGLLGHQFVLPGKVTARLIEQAAAQAAELEEERKAKEAEEEKAGDEETEEQAPADEEEPAAEPDEH
jgi:S1-C subfamily serine protease